MHAVVLSALPASNPSLASLALVLDAELARAGYDTSRTFELASTKLAFCQGEFDCWVKTPGLCRSKDIETEIVAAVHDADALVFLGPVTFGGHGDVLKRAIDRLLCLLSPFFEKRHSLTHHGLRYAKHQSLFSVGWAQAVSPDVAATFDELNDANAINYLSPRRGSVVLDAARAGEWASAIRDMLTVPKVPGEEILAREPLRRALLAACAPQRAAAVPSPPNKVALLVGSPKKKGTSASEVLARALIERFARVSVPSELHFATEFVHDNDRAKECARSIRGCDLFLLVTPLYVDAFPALTTHALELVTRAPRESSAPARFATLVNCGFPETEQNRTAFRMARHFATEAGYLWAGGLSLGGGGVITPGQELSPAGPVAHVVRALDLAVPALAQGSVIPLESIEAMAEAPMPDVLYRLIGDIGWRWQAHRNGLAQRELGARPLDA
jgi:multimeric flavodoxin WrbA